MHRSNKHEVYHFSLYISFLHVLGSCLAYMQVPNARVPHTCATLVYHTQSPKYSPKYSFEEKWCLCTKMWNKFIFSRMLLVCTRLLLVCYSCVLYVLVCYSYALVCTRMYSYVTRMYSYVTRMLLVCSFSHDPQQECCLGNSRISFNSRWTEVNFSSTDWISYMRTQLKVLGGGVCEAVDFP